MFELPPDEADLHHHTPKGEAHLMDSLTHFHGVARSMNLAPRGLEITAEVVMGLRKGLDEYEQHGTEAAFR